MVKWILIGVGALVVWYMIKDTSGSPASRPTQTKATTGNAGFTVNVGSGGVSVGW